MAVPAARRNPPWWLVSVVCSHPPPSPPVVEGAVLAVLLRATLQAQACQEGTVRGLVGVGSEVGRGRVPPLRNLLAWCVGASPSQL